MKALWSEIRAIAEIDPSAETTEAVKNALSSLVERIEFLSFEILDSSIESAIQDMHATDTHAIGIDVREMIYLAEFAADHFGQSSITCEYGELMSKIYNGANSAIGILADQIFNSALSELKSTIEILKSKYPEYLEDRKTDSLGWHVHTSEHDEGNYYIYRHHDVEEKGNHLDSIEVKFLGQFIYFVGRPDLTE